MIDFAALWAGKKSPVQLAETSRLSYKGLETWGKIKSPSPKHVQRNSFRKQKHCFVFLPKLSLLRHGSGPAHTPQEKPFLPVLEKQDQMEYLLDIAAVQRLKEKRLCWTTGKDVIQLGTAEWQSAAGTSELKTP